MKRTAASSRLGRALNGVWQSPQPTVPQQALLASLAPAALLFAAGTRFRNAAYDRRWLASRAVKVPVISVGNLTVGGAGKTPVVLAVSERLAALGHRVAIVNRGYGGRRAGKSPIVVSDGSGSSAPPAEAGDEAILLARRLPSAIVVAGADRHAASQLAISIGASVIVLDDGMQHRRLHRDLEILVVDASDPLGNGLPLPVGPLREGISAIERAHLIWFSRVDEVPSYPLRAAAALRRIEESAGLPVVRGIYEPSLLLDAGGDALDEASSLRGRAVVAVCGVARPSSFLFSLSSLGARIVETHVFPDHHPFDERDLERVFADARESNALVLTTEKDAARLPPSCHGDVRVLRVEARVMDGEAVLDEALGRLAPPLVSDDAPGKTN